MSVSKQLTPKLSCPPEQNSRDCTQYTRCERITPNRPFCRRVNCSALLGVATSCLDKIDQPTRQFFELARSLLIDIIELRCRQHRLAQPRHGMLLKAAILDLHLQGVEDAVKLSEGNRRAERFEDLTNRLHSSVNPVPCHDCPHPTAPDRLTIKLSCPPSSGLMQAVYAMHKGNAKLPDRLAGQLQRLVRRAATNQKWIASLGRRQRGQNYL